MTVGEDIRRLRHASGLTLKELAARSGISTKALIDMELDRPVHAGMNYQRVFEQLQEVGATSEYTSGMAAGHSDVTSRIEASQSEVRTLQMSMAPTASRSHRHRIVDILAAIVSVIGVSGIGYVQDNLRGTPDAFLAFAVALAVALAYPVLRLLRSIRAEDKLDHITRLWNESRTHVSGGNYEAALSLLDKAVQLNREYAGPCQIYLEKGKVLAELGRAQDAIDNLEQFKSKARNVRSLGNELAEAQLLLGKFRS